MTVAVTPGTWQQDPSAIDPCARAMLLTVEGAAPGRWEVGNGGAHGFFLHLRHDGHHFDMVSWNDWEAVARAIERESGPYTVTVSGPAPAFYCGATLSQAKLIAVRAERTPFNVAVIDDSNGNEVTWNRGPAERED